MMISTERDVVNIHPNDWVQYISQLQSMVQSRRDQDGARTSIVHDQL
jgi:hypothetical protein